MKITSKLLNKIATYAAIAFLSILILAFNILIFYGYWVLVVFIDFIFVIGGCYAGAEVLKEKERQEERERRRY